MSSNGYNFTARVRNVLAGAREEAFRLHHEYVGTEHMLLGLIKEAEGVGINVFIAQNIEPKRIRDEVEKQVKTGKSAEGATDLPYTSRAKKVLELSMAEARELNHSYVGTEHLLLGLLREEKGIAAQVLTAAGLTLNVARTEVLKLLGGAPSPRLSPDDSQHRFEARVPGAIMYHAPVIKKPIASVVINVHYDDGTVRHETFASTMAAISFLGSVHRAQMDS